MVRVGLFLIAVLFGASGVAVPGRPGLRAATQAPATAQPEYETRKITENVYTFRFGGSQALFVVTPDGVIATDPLNPRAAKIYLEEIRRITQAPVLYVVYSHHHVDHVAGGAPFKQAGATFVAQRQARNALIRLKIPDIVIPDLVVDEQSVLTVGGTRVELHFVGRNHSDNSLVMFLPKERIIFAVDFLPVREILFRNMPDSYIPEYLESVDRVLQLDFDRLILGHSRAGGMGTKDDVRALKGYLDELFAAVRVASSEGKCPDRAMQEIKLPKYAGWGRQEFLPGNIERMCYYFTLGWQ